MDYKAITEYTGLITSQYRRATNFLAWLTASLQMLDDLDVLSTEMLTKSFDLDNAVGDQLDLLGDILGQQRHLPFDPTDGSDPELPDELYRGILRFKIGVNSWDGQVGTIHYLWNQLFPEVALDFDDNQDMSCTITFTGYLPRLVTDMINNDLLLPRPEGVRYDFGEIEVLPYFSYDLDDDYFTGYDYGYWDVSTSGAFGEPPIMNSAYTNSTGTVITMSFNKVMANPIGNEDHFTVRIGSSPYEYDVPASIALNSSDNTKIDLTLSSSPEAIIWGDTITISYSPGAVKSSVDSQLLGAFNNRNVTNTMTEPAGPTVVSAETSTDGTYIIVTMSKEMMDPAGSEGDWDVVVNGSTHDTVTSATLGATAYEIYLYLTTAIVYGDTVVVSYYG